MTVILDRNEKSKTNNLFFQLYFRRLNLRLSRRALSGARVFVTRRPGSLLCPGDAGDEHVTGAGWFS